MRRREFVASGVSTAAWALGLGSPPRSTPAAQLRFGYAAITWGGDDRQAIDDIAAVGFRGVQLRQSAFATWGERPAALSDLLAERRLVLVALSSGNVTLDPSREQENLAQHVRHARFVRDAGGQYLQVLDERPGGRAPLAEDYHRLGRLLDELGRRAADLGIKLAYHNHMGALGEAPAEVARVLDATDPRFVHLLLDTAHYQQAGGDPASAVRRHAVRLLFLHIKDLAGSRFVELGRGTVDFTAVFAALQAIDFSGWGIVELDSASSPKDSAVVARRYLESLGQRI